MEQHNLAGRFFTKTDIGRVRKDNEDFADARINAYGQIILIVADGMGGHNAGDYASRYTVDTMVEEIEKSFEQSKERHSSENQDLLQAESYTNQRSCSHIPEGRPSSHPDLQ